MDDICNIIVAACILHDLCIESGDSDFQWNAQTVEDGEDEREDTVPDPSAREVYQAGRQVRDELNLRWSEFGSRQSRRYFFLNISLYIKHGNLYPHRFF